MYSKKGFSLIELIVVISIITVFFGISVAVYKNSLDEKRLTIDIKLLESIIQDTKQRARARDISPMTTCRVFESYNLVINPV
ncbi:MAG: prepilin-type N-terminal cleavage/methylation domain-containing protein, partial [Candidatus Roizmanbacteria bacterium]|nr:prepilin-type N-terminal cleavage/methylation domain-containing protein [Candidatus Roizmanbacteria bacterium]